jgi:hypothetical protein
MIPRAEVDGGILRADSSDPSIECSKCLEMLFSALRQSLACLSVVPVILGKDDGLTHRWRRLRRKADGVDCGRKGDESLE